MDVHTGKMAAVNRPETWATFEEAVAYYQEHQGQGIKGVGFVLTQDDPYVFFDLDECIQIPEPSRPGPWN